MRLTKAFLFSCLCLAAASLLFAQAPAKDANREKTPAGFTPSPAEIAQGKQLFQAKCAICHYSESAAKKIGPGLKGLSKLGKDSDGKPVDDASLRAWIEKGGKNMPGYKDALNPAKVRALVAYLKTL